MSNSEAVIGARESDTIGINPQHNVKWIDGKKLYFSVSQRLHVLAKHRLKN